MRTYEAAAVSVAVKRSRKAGNIETGYKAIEEWANRWKDKGVSVDKATVIKCFNKWVKHWRYCAFVS